MAINLGSLVSPSKRSLFFTVISEAGMGKTTLASLFPSPVFIRTEDGTRSIEAREDVALFPVAKSSGEVLEAIALLVTEDHKFRTVIIDSVTKLNDIIEAEVVAMDGKAKSINQAAGGYGAGYAQASGVHREIREACGFLAEKKGMNVVFIAHADTESVDLPDQDQFSRYTIRMNKRSISHYIDNVDVVAYIKLRMFVAGKEGEKKRAGTDGSRIITCYPTPSHISKNRLGIKTDLPFTEGENPFKAYL